MKALDHRVTGLSDLVCHSKLRQIEICNLPFNGNTLRFRSDSNVRYTL